MEGRMDGPGRTPQKRPPSRVESPDQYAQTSLSQCDPVDDQRIEPPRKRKGAT
jgi:hypothetical protein